MRLEELIGQTLVFGIPGTRVRPEDIRLFKETNAGGLILYRINFESPSQVKKLISDLESALNRRLLVMADHEGGRVVMFRDGVTIFPDNLAFGTAGMVSAAKKQGEIEAKELRRLGMDINLGPVVDVLTKEYSPNIGIRAYGRDPKLVAAMASARIEGMQKYGISACAKHFPGKGHSPLDAHLSLPTIPSTWAEMRKVHIKPFLAAMEAGVDMIMSSHPLYPNLDPTPRTPATFSRRLITNYLREELGYKGVISSDDLEMGAMKEICSIGQAAVLTFKAGHDLILSCHDVQAQREVYTALVEGFKSGELSTTELEKSVARLDQLKLKREKRFTPGAARPEKNGASLALQVTRKAVLVKGPAKKVLPLGRREKNIHVIFPRLSDFAPRIMIEKSLENETAFLKKSLSHVKKAALKFQIVPVDPSPQDIDQAAQAAETSDAVVFFCFDAHLHPKSKDLLDAVQKISKKFVLVLLRDHYDEAFAAKSTVVVTGFGFRLCQLQACLEKIFHK
jgi:beta-N-acetylhexosaminidase